MQKASCLYSVFPSARCIKWAKLSLHNCTDENTRAALRLTHWLSAASPTQNCLRLQPEPKGCRYRCSEASLLQSKYRRHLIQDTNDFSKFQIKIVWPYTTSDLQGISTKILEVLICKANFWKGRTRTRVGSQKCHFAAMHSPECQMNNTHTEYWNPAAQLPAQTLGSHCNSVLRGRMATTGLLWWLYPGWILQCLTSVRTTTVLLVCLCELYRHPYLHFPLLHSLL